MLVLAEKIGDFISYIGGIEHSVILIPILEYLCHIEETAVRNAVVASTNKILSHLDSSSQYKAQIQGKCLHLLKLL